MFAKDQDPSLQALQTQSPLYPQVVQFRQSVPDETAATDTIYHSKSPKSFRDTLPASESGVASLARR